jgi:hypothetical protein
MWWVTTQKSGASALGLQRVLGLNRTFAIGGFGNAKALYFQRRSP